MGEADYWRDYEALRVQYRAENKRCACHGRYPDECDDWQKLRLVIRPSPEEERYLNGRA